MSSSAPILTTNSYRLTAKDFFNFYWTEFGQRYWYIVVIFLGLMLLNMINALLTTPFPANLISPLVFVGVLFFVRYRFMAMFKRKYANGTTITMTLFHDCIESRSESGASGIFHFDEIKGLRNRKWGYAVRLTNGNTFFVLKNGFKTAEDEALFGQTIRDLIDKKRA